MLVKIHQRLPCSCVWWGDKMGPSSIPFQQGSPGFCFRSPLQVPHGTLQNGYILPFGEKNSLQGLVLEVESVLGKPVKMLLLQELSWTLAAPPVCRLQQTQRYAVTRELTQADSLGAFSGLSHHTLLHTCGETRVSANRSQWVQLPVMFLGVCSRDGTQPNILDYCHPGISHTRKIPNCP